MAASRTATANSRVALSDEASSSVLAISALSDSQIGKTARDKAH